MEHVCPLLGLAGDRRAVIDGADGAHRCHAEAPPSTIDRALQVQLCLTPAHQRCERFAAHLAQRPGATPGRSAAGDGFVSTRLVLTAQPPWRGVAGRARRSRSAVVVGGVASIALLGIAGVAVANSIAGGPEESAPAATSSATSPTATPRPTATPEPSATVTSAATPSSTPSLEPTAVPTPSPAPPVTYTVVAGDSLVEIADRFGVTVDALLAANDIDDPEQLRIGQVLVIP